MGNCFITRRGSIQQGFFPSLFVTGLSEQDTCTATCNGKSFVGEWATKTVEEEVALIPNMTSDTTPSGSVSYSHQYSDQYAYEAFDGNLISHWSTYPQTTNEWIAYEFDEPKVVTKIGLYNYFAGNSANIKNFKFERYDDGSWVTLLTNVAQEGNTIEQFFEFDNNVASTKYRLFVIDTKSTGNGISLCELQLYGTEEIEATGFYFPRLTELGTYTVSNGTSTMEILIDAPIEYTLEWSTIPRNGLVAEYLFDGDTLDTSPNGNDLTNNGVTFSNNAGVFNGSAKATISKNLITDSTPYSISAWFKTTSTSGGIIGFGDYGTDKKGHMIRIDGGKVQTTASKGTSGTHAFNYSTPLTYNDGLWHHLVLTNDNGNTNKLKLYVDDVLVINQNTNYTIANMTNQLTTIGCLWSSSYATYFNGSLDNIRIYNRVLTDVEIEALSAELPHALIPTMTSDTTPSGIITCSKQYSPNQVAWKAFDGNTTTAFSTYPDEVGWIAYEFPSAKKVTSIEFWSTGTNGCVKNFTFDGV